MARYKGKDGSITVGAATVGEVESFDLEISVNELDANVMGSDWTDVEAGQSSASGSIAVLTDPGDAGQTALVVGTSVALVLFPTSNTTGLKSYSGNFLITSTGRSTSVGDLVKTTYGFRNKGAVTEATIV